MENNNAIYEEISSFHLPRYKELPDMGLYLEQVVRYINNCLAPLGCMEITSSMVSNYVKKGLVDNPVKKQYFAPHLAELLFIALGKRVLSIENLGKMLQIIKSDITNELYDNCCAEFENRLSYVFGLAYNIPQTEFEESETKMMLDEVLTAVVFAIHLDFWFNEREK